ncbi:hypothetical protein OIU76_018856 [Salix suchowensis]|nr:hypothetical protein OIU76_018856 [Salix suchowensis]
MAKHQYGLLLFFSILVSLSLVSFVSCILAESKKAKKEDLKLSNKLCELPQSHAFGFGIAALTWLVIAQVVGNVMICAHFRHTESSKAMKPKIATGLLVFSWWVLSCLCINCCQLGFPNTHMHPSSSAYKITSVF